LFNNPSRNIIKQQISTPKPASQRFAVGNGGTCNDPLPGVEAI